MLEHNLRLCERKTDAAPTRDYRHPVALATKHNSIFRRMGLEPLASLVVAAPLGRIIGFAIVGQTFDTTERSEKKHQEDSPYQETTCSRIVHRHFVVNPQYNPDG